jgi:hypothetical protein
MQRRKEVKSLRLVYFSMRIGYKRVCRMHDSVFPYSEILQVNYLRSEELYG